MGLALYRKYRPALFAEVRGQERVTVTLQAALQRALVGQAYIFSGPRGTGKTTVARLLARAVNCETVKNGRLKNGEPCNKCAACVRAQQGQELDFVEIDAASNRGIDEIRELRERVRFAPSQTQKKVFLIDEFHMLTKEAFNALLKTLEEPPAHAIFILATTEIHQVPATILSRAQHFSFRALPQEILRAELARVAQAEKIAASSEALALLAEQAEGGARDALSLLDLLRAAAGQKEITVDLIREVLALPNVARLEMWLTAVAAGEATGALASLRQALEEGVDAIHFGKTLVRYVRLVLLYGIEPLVAEQAAGSLTTEQRARAKEFATQFPRKQLLVTLARINQAVSEIKGSTVAALPLEVATLTVLQSAHAETQVTTPHTPPGTSAPTSKKTIKLANTERPKKVPAKEQLQKTAPKSAPREVTTPSDNLENVDTGLLNKLLAGWQEALALIRAENLGVAELLRQAIVLKVQNRAAWMVVEYGFYKERVSERRNRHLVERILEERFGEKLRLHCLVPTELSRDEHKLYLAKKKEQAASKLSAPAPAPAEPLADLALSLLGGQVVE